MAPRGRARSSRSAAGAGTTCGAGQQDLLFTRVFGQRRGSLELSACFREAPELFEQIAAHAGQKVIVAESWLASERIDERGLNRKAMEIATARLSSTMGGALRQRVIQDGDPFPIGSFGSLRDGSSLARPVATGCVPC